jgi:hypothetical protein
VEPHGQDAVVVAGERQVLVAVEVAGIWHGAIAFLDGTFGVRWARETLGACDAMAMCEPPTDIRCLAIPLV